MIAKAAAVWVVGLLTLVPYGTYYLFFEASREQYALLITLILFWIFGYWGVVTPILVLVKARLVFRAIENARSSDDLRRALGSPEAREVGIELIAGEYRIPRLIARLVYDRVVMQISRRASDQSR